MNDDSSGCTKAKSSSKEQRRMDESSTQFSKPIHCFFRCRKKESIRSDRYIRRKEMTYGFIASMQRGYTDRILIIILW
jgi:hypothetical protein